MAVSPIPEGYNTVTPYLVVDKPFEIIAMLSALFDATIRAKTMAEDRLMNAEIVIGTSVIMIGEAQPGGTVNSTMLYLYVEDVDASYEKAISYGCEVIMEPTDMFYGDRHYAIRDVSGNQWWVASRRENLTESEMAKRVQALNR